MKLKFDLLSQFLIGWAYTLVLVCLMAVILYPKVPVTEIVLLSLASYLVVSLAFLTKLTTGLLIGLLGAGGICGALLYLLRAPFAKPFNRLIDDIVTLWGRIAYVEPHDEPEMLTAALVFIIFSSIAAALLVVLLFQKHFSFFLMTGVTLSMVLFSWYMTAKENRIVFSILCTLTILSYVRHVFTKKKKLGLVSESLPVGSFMLFTLPLALMPVVAISFMPKNDLPIQWPWLDKKIANVIEYLEARFSYTDVEFFSLSTTGFNGRSQRLGGPVRPSSKVVMDVKAEKRTYLRGAVYSWYENNMWVQTRNERPDAAALNENESELQETRIGWLNIPTEEMFPDVSEDDRLLLMNLSSGKLNSVLFPTHSMEVRYRNITTRTVFMPLKSIVPIKKTDGSPLDLTENLHGAAVSKSKLPAGTAYKLDYVQPLYGEPMLKKALTFSRKGLYLDAMNLLLQKRNAAAASDDGASPKTTLLISNLDQRIESLSRLSERAMSVEAEYTGLNDAIPQRVKDLAFSLTQGCKSDYERVLAVESYLRDNFQYTLNAKMAPKGQDFVDYFLFEEKKGYCTYFATSMTIMLRTLGIPARYVEGYVLPEEPNEDSIYTVANKHAHAWVEVYFEGFGWLTFEPTSVYADVLDYRKEADNGDFPGVPYMTDIEKLIEQYRNSPEVPGYIPKLDGTNQTDNRSRYTAVFLWGIGGLIALSVLFNMAASILGSIFIKRLKNGKKVKRLYELMLKWLMHVGYSVKPGETLIEFSKRIDNLYYFSNVSFREATEVFYKVRYGMTDAGREEADLVVQVSKELKRSILKELGLRRYMPLRRIFLEI